jgi:hypothetical protein
MIKLKAILKEAKLYTFSGADGVKVKHKNMCHKVARQQYFKLKNKGKNIKYVEGLVYAPMGDTSYKWIEHAWNLINGKVVDFAYGKNDYMYKGYIVKDEYMDMLPKWMQSFAGPEDVCDINIRVGNEYGKKAYE